MTVLWCAGQAHATPASFRQKRYDTDRDDSDTDDSAFSGASVEAVDRTEAGSWEYEEEHDDWQW